MKKYYTDSDGGTILFGNENFTFTVYNKFGDCRNTVIVFENDEEYLTWLMDKYGKKYYRDCNFDYITCCKGTFNLYKYDCLSDKELKDRKNIKAKLSGTYLVYVRCGNWEYPIIAIVKSK